MTLNQVDDAGWSAEDWTSLTDLAASTMEKRAQLRKIIPEGPDAPNEYWVSVPTTGNTPSGPFGFTVATTQKVTRLHVSFVIRAEQLHDTSSIRALVQKAAGELASLEDRVLAHGLNANAPAALSFAQAATNVAGARRNFAAALQQQPLVQANVDAAALALAQADAAEQAAAIPQTVGAGVIVQPSPGLFDQRSFPAVQAAGGAAAAAPAAAAQLSPAAVVAQKLRTGVREVRRFFPAPLAAALGFDAHMDLVNDSSSNNRGGIERGRQTLGAGDAPLVGLPPHPTGYMDASLVVFAPEPAALDLVWSQRPTISQVGIANGDLTLRLEEAFALRIKDPNAIAVVQ